MFKLGSKSDADILKSISPSMKVLSSREAKLILRVMDECIHQIEIVSFFPSLLENPEPFTKSLGENLLRTLKEHQELEERHKCLVLDGSHDQTNSQVALSAKAVQDSFRKIVRILRGTAEALRSKETQCAEDIVKMRDGLCELREIVLERLLTSPGEEKQLREMVLEVSQSHAANQVLIDSLEKDLAMAVKDKDEEQLRSTLQQKEKALQEFVGRTQQDAEKQTHSDQKTSEGKRARLQQEASQLNSQINNLIAANREAEVELRKKKYKEETEIENVIQKYDVEMGEKQTELEEMIKMHETDQTELRELEELYDVLDVEYSQIMEERQKAQELKELQEKELEIQSKAATVIQALWRGFCTRKALKSSAKSKKAKKGKGKKKK
ncbi:hypothetical protein DNTS_016497 [Danionella cerebrum]|uniref:Dynein regulatory complex protein 10 n=1 Tax=Danionella cerebrum TaxID=2873325 RepID=A0A553RIU6_9TELE|nr:hypothetical protein DNTS_016497 [Danionella translucida]